MRLENVRFSYGEKTIFDGLSVTFPKNGIVCLTGASGCGKTTLLRLLCGLETPQSGALHDMPQRPAVLFQENRLLPWETALGNLTAVVDDKQRALHLLETVDLKDAASQYPREMSGGMQRRLALARALALSSDVLLLDEPFNGIDRFRAEAVAQYVREYAATRLVILVTHVAEDAALLGAQVWALEGTPVHACRPIV